MMKRVAESGDLVVAANTPVMPKNTIRARFKENKWEKIAPSMAPTKSEGAKTPPLTPEPTVKLVAKIFAIKRSIMSCNDTVVVPTNCMTSKPKPATVSSSLASNSTKKIIRHVSADPIIGHNTGVAYFSRIRLDVRKTIEKKTPIKPATMPRNTTKGIRVKENNSNPMGISRGG